MLKVQLIEDQGIAILEPDGELSKADFESASKIIDPYLEKHGTLNGIIIHVRLFPGWESFSSLVAHLKFVKEHHRKVSRIAVATDSPIGGVAEKLAPHFINAKIKRFPFDEFQTSKEWVVGGGKV
jgi:hypothetical protein